MRRLHTKGRRSVTEQRNETALPIARTLAEIRAEMNSLDQGDPEATHSRGDDLLIEALWSMVASRRDRDEIGSLVDAWRRLEKWYA